ncbi:MAG: molybdopterin-dependent oxidoreductase [Candidatus Thorarchaeota archaeon]
MTYFEDFPTTIEEYPPVPPITTRNRIPKGQSVTKKFSVLSIDPTPKFNGKDWDLEITGAIENPKKFSWKEILDLPKATVKADFHCVTGWSRLDNVWEGVLFKTICDIVKPLPEAIAVTSYGNQFYTSSMPLKDYMLDDDVILAYRHDLDQQGQFLDPEHGGPLRLVIPKIYAYKSTKWLKKLDFTTTWERGFWEQRGYHQRASPFLDERYSSQEKKVKRNRLELQKEFREKYRF